MAECLKYSSSFLFEGGNLTVKVDGYSEADKGSGHFCFADDDLQFDEEEGKLYRWISIAADDLQDLKKWLNENLP